MDTDSSDTESCYNVFEVKNVPSLLSSFDGTLIDSEYLKMTSLRSLLYLSHNKDDEYNDESSDKLSLAYERLHRMPKIIEDELGEHVTHLDISHNEFDNLDFLKRFTRLNSLICDHNNINAATRIPSMPNLELLWMNHCQIRDLHPWAHHLQHAVPNLRYLSLMDNPAAPSYLNGGNFYDYLQYRLYIINLFPNLVHLDDRPVSEEQRAEAHRLFKDKSKCAAFVHRLFDQERALLPECVRTRLCNLYHQSAPGGGKKERNIIV